jgi:hypothetical protein
MNTSVVIRGTLSLPRRRRGQQSDAGEPSPNPAASARIPRIARLMALARHVDELVRSGTVASYASVARLGRVSRARLSQIIGLLNLAPDLQEQGNEGDVQELLQPLALLRGYVVLKGLAEARNAHELLGKGGVTGKIVLVSNGSSLKSGAA